MGASTPYRFVSTDRDVYSAGGAHGVELRVTRFVNSGELANAERSGRDLPIRGIFCLVILPNVRHNDP